MWQAKPKGEADSLPRSTHRCLKYVQFTFILLWCKPDLCWASQPQFVGSRHCTSSWCAMGRSCWRWSCWDLTAWSCSWGNHGKWRDFRVIHSDTQWLATPWLAIAITTWGVEHHILPKHGSPFGLLDYRTADTRCHFRGGYRRSHCWRGCERSKTRTVEWCVIQMLDCHPRARRNRLAWRHFLLPIIIIILIIMPLMVLNHCALRIHSGRFKFQLLMVQSSNVYTRPRTLISRSGYLFCRSTACRKTCLERPGVVVIIAALEQAPASGNHW